ncbi:MAG: C4-dicarboxylate transporter DctM subunit [Myxococcota bacterium]|jgi:C4-dicarboxylate transporter DctM subunit
MVQALVDAVGAGFRIIDSGIRGAASAGRATWTTAAAGPLQELVVWSIIIGTGILVVAERAGQRFDQLFGRLERALVSIAMVLMTFLAFNEYLAREFSPSLGDLGGLWALEGQMNMALLLMVVVGFLGASIATQERKHIAVDAIDRVLSVPSAKFVRRLTNGIAAVLCAVFAHGSWEAVFRHCHDAFEGARVWGPLVAPINGLVTMMPGDKYGIGTPFPTMDDWIDAQYDADLDPFASFAFGFVDAGSRFPLWVPVLFLVAAFAIMSLRFAGHALYVQPSIDSPRGAPSRRPADIVLAGALPGALVVLALGAWLGTGWLVLLSSVALVFLGAPLFVAVGVGTLACWILLRGGSAETVVSDMFEATKKQELLAIPFFVLAGNLMTRGSIATRLIAFARACIGGVPGGLGVGAVAACAFFAAISGSSPVTVIAIGSIMFPMLIKEGYTERFSMGLLTTAGGLGIIIPPSIPMIVYAIMVSNAPGVGVIDPATLFMAGVGPGLFIASTLAMYTFYVMWPRDAAPSGDVDWSAWGADVGRTFLRGVPSLMLPVLILGGIYGVLDFAPFGVEFAIRFTVTEAAAVAVVYALAVELLLHRELRLRDLPSVFSESAVMMGSLFLILVIAISLNRFFVFQQIPEAATDWMLARVDSQFTFLIMVNLFLLALGCVMDILSAILIVAPLLAPIAASYGIHPIHFGIMFIVNLELGYLTPPMGINLFVASTVFERPILEVIRAVVPFLLLMLGCLAVIVWVPELSLFLVE